MGAPPGRLVLRTVSYQVPNVGESPLRGQCFQLDLGMICSKGI